ncbi:site-specific DNA-methyltransferase [Candidatus Viridilinea mediisalina]|uniref:site-specific DNA-methyltransferase n=1 Tax=Candidatus Viridilinea mediisalina TaxID=2024553 RepID=UPI001FE69792|nr:site-specific DNA-methyltransferase [Candidatus Viridilinea mediisalina]
MPSEQLPLNEIIQGSCLDLLKTLPEQSVDLIFADPPYNLQLQHELLRPNQTVVDGVADAWDQFADFAEYDHFTEQWLSACRRVLKDNGTIWVIGSYHNIFRVGKIMMDLGYWLLNDVIWHKTNPMPNFRGTRFQNATETLIWAKKSATQKKYTFHYQAMKNFNDEKQMQNVWYIPLCTGAERIKINGKKAHSTQKPEALLHRVILSSSNRGDVVLDPFSGSGTTAAVAKRLQRRYIGIEISPEYVAISQERLASLPASPVSEHELVTKSKRDAPRISFGQLIEAGYLAIGQQVFSKDRKFVATIKADAHLIWQEQSGSIHKIAALIQNRPAYNGWEYWYCESATGSFVSIDDLREQYRREH